MTRVRNICLWGLAVLAATAGARGQSIVWQPWSNQVWAQAKREHKLVLLDLEAVWCHWCHVMDATTYRDPEVAALIAKHYLAVKVDQDARPDLANRYQDFGWPATVIYAADGSEIIKKRGYISPVGMRRFLRTVAAGSLARGGGRPQRRAAGRRRPGPDRCAPLRRRSRAGLKNWVIRGYPMMAALALGNNAMARPQIGRGPRYRSRAISRLRLGISNFS